jgi:hypothetical protein
VHSRERLEPFYAGRLWRKMRLNGYLNRGRSERTMLAGFQATFGTPANVVIGMGDWEQRGHCKFKEPTKGKGLRTLLRRAGYRVLLVDEFRTSLQCSDCQTPEATCTKFLRRPGSAWPDHGLLRCQLCKRRRERRGEHGPAAAAGASAARPRKAPSPRIPATRATKAGMMMGRGMHVDFGSVSNDPPIHYRVFVFLGNELPQVEKTPFLKPWK